MVCAKHACDELLTFEAGPAKLGHGTKPDTFQGPQGQGVHVADPHTNQTHDPNDPVWVLRESYLKRMQREQDAANAQVQVREFGY